MWPVLRAFFWLAVLVALAIILVWSATEPAAVTP